MKIFNYWSLLLLLVVGLSACEKENELFTLHEDPNNYAPLVTVERETNLIDYAADNPTYTFMLDDPADIVTTYDLQVTSTAIPDTVDLLSVNTFPSEVSVTLSEVANAFGATVADFAPGDEITFLATTTGSNGYSITADDLNGDAFNTGIMQGLRHSVLIFCPFNVADAVGTYDVTSLGFGEFFGETATTREVVAGPGENQITIVGGAYPAVGSDDLVLDIDPSNGVASLGASGTAFSAAAGAFDTDNYGSANGFAFSCAGTITLTLDFDAYAGNAHDFNLVKQ